MQRGGIWTRRLILNCLQDFMLYMQYICIYLLFFFFFFFLSRKFWFDHIAKGILLFLTIWHIFTDMSFFTTHKQHTHTHTHTYTYTPSQYLHSTPLNSQHLSVVMYCHSPTCQPSVLVLFWIAHEVASQPLHHQSFVLHCCCFLL